MDTGSFEEITTEGELRELLGEPTPVALTKERRTLHDHHKQWLAASPLCLISTSAADGTCDVSPKGDPAGFTKVLDDTTLVVPDRPGNRRADSYHNVVRGQEEEPAVGVALLQVLDQLIPYAVVPFLIVESTPHPTPHAWDTSRSFAVEES